MIAAALFPDAVSYVERLAPDTPFLLINDWDVIVSATAFALRSGVVRGMRLRQARSLCPDAEVRYLHEAPYRELTSALEEELQSVSAYVESASPFWQKRPYMSPLMPLSAVAWFLDIGRLTPTDAREMMIRLNTQLKTRFALMLTFGLASGKFPALVAANRAIPANPVQVQRGAEAEFVAALPIACLPLSRHALRQLGYLGVYTLRDIAELPVSTLTMLGGKMGRLAHQLAQGIDPRSIAKYQRERVERIQRSFEGGVENSLLLDAILSELGGEIAKRLDGKTVRTLEITFIQERGHAVSVRRTVHEPLSHPSVIGRTLMRLRSQAAIEASVIGVEVVARDIAPMVWQQLALFGTPVEQRRLSDLIEMLLERFETDALYEMRPWEIDHLLTDRRYRMSEVIVA